MVDNAGIARALQERLGYPHVFVWVLVSTIPGFIVAAIVKIDPEYGKQMGDGGRETGDGG